jgi:Uma2 family endonuclease
MSNLLQPHRFSVAEYHRMIELGILREDHRVELIAGEIVAKMPTGERHNFTLIQLNDLLSVPLAGRAICLHQSPVTLQGTEPEPDLVLLERAPSRYRTRKAIPADVLLLVEIADSSLEIDRSVKLPLYAENGIVEYWIVNLVENQIEVYRHPQANGTYAVSLIRRPGGNLDVLAFPDILISVSELLG